MRVLVLSANYPDNDGSHERMYVHTRNIYYQKCGIVVNVLNFKTKKDYSVDGVEVISLDSFNKNNWKYDILICHQSNIRNHYIFLRKHAKEFGKIVFFFHGHEIMYLNHTYPKPYSFCKKNTILKKAFQELYDVFKTTVWHFYLPTFAGKAEIVFVSEYVREMFYKNVRLKSNVFDGNEHIINNGVSKIFEEKSYKPTDDKEYDFITIRSNWDSSVYCVDLLVKLAAANQNKTFLLIGKGDYFKYNEAPGNLILINKTISHDEMIGYLNSSRCALNLSRQDTQGVMTCELLTFGIPVITSDIPIAKYFFEKKKNVAFIENDSIPIELDYLLNELQAKLPFEKDYSFFEKNTVEKEVELLKGILH